MASPSIYELCRPRADVLEGRIRDEDFAADLSQVLRGTAPDLYSNPALFFANTHPTRGLCNLIKAVVDRLTAADSQLGSILRLDTSYGGGKTHALIGLHHILTAPGQIPNLDEFVDPATLPGQPVTLAAFDGENADPMNGRRMDANVLAYTPWGELAVQLAGPVGYERIRNSDRFGAPPPGAETLRELIGQRPVLILIDELSVYLRKLRGAAAGQAASQLTPFLTDLIKAVSASSNAVLVFTLALGKGGQAVDAYGEENFAELQSVTGRQITALTPTSEDETVQVLCRRLFESIDRSRVEDVVRAYQHLWSRHSEALPPLGQNGDRAGNLRSGADRHPDAEDLHPGELPAGAGHAAAAGADRGSALARATPGGHRHPPPPHRSWQRADPPGDCHQAGVAGLHPGDPRRCVDHGGRGRQGPGPATRCHGVRGPGALRLDGGPHGAVSLTRLQRAPQGPRPPGAERQPLRPGDRSSLRRQGRAPPAGGVGVSRRQQHQQAALPQRGQSQPDGAQAGGAVRPGDRAPGVEPPHRHDLRQAAFRSGVLPGQPGRDPR
ncbi:MAG: ATP-binding protein [Aphanocapsa feldmannii 277cI]|uniref:ATP-binding protein n=1 Tax=Aphanocapsa feldmannii 277cI TaxID=2507554 RepID=A0A524RT65_9CHRO|nr:MAG: ATP-binding protein [Aphanocapsa feldmannii 277cI]